MDSDIKKEEKNCEICKEIATNVCFECSFYLCNSCFKFIHEKKANLSHQKEDIDPYISLDIKCPEHPKNSLNLFCSEEKRKNIFFILK